MTYYGNDLYSPRNGVNPGNNYHHSGNSVVFPSPIPKIVNIKIYSYGSITVILPITLYGRETCLPPQTNKYRLKVFKSRVLKRIFGPKILEVIKQWKILHNEQLHNLCLATLH
jgi:hypothetical protein